MKIYTTTPVGELREPLLAVLASWIHGSNVGVECTSSSLHAVQLACHSRTLVVHPRHCSLLLLLLAAELLAHRGELSRGRGAVDETIVASWLPAAQRRLVARFPGLANLPATAWQQCVRAGRLPVVRWLHAEVSPPKIETNAPTQGDSPPDLSKGALEFALPDCELASAHDTLSELAAGIASGAIAARHLDELPDVPYVAVRVRLGNRVDVGAGRAEQFEHHRLAFQAARAFARCMRSSLEGLVLEPTASQGSTTGRELDMRRLPMARVATRLGRDFPVFVGDPEELSHFDPQDHRVVMYSDLTNHKARLDDAAPSMLLNIAMAYGYELLGIPIEWHASQDHLVRGPNGRKVLLHLDFVMKGFDEEWSPIIWERLDRVSSYVPWLDSKPGLFAPLHMHRAAELLAQNDAADATKSWWHLVLSMGPNLDTMRHVRASPERFAAHMEATLQRLHAQRRTKAMAWLPAGLRHALPRDAMLRKALIND
jgi:hypothetical protein